MAAPAGVNEGIPHDPVTAGGGVEVAEAHAAGAEPTDAGHAGPKPAGVVAAEAVPPPAAPAEGEMAPASDARPAVAEPADGPPAEAGPAEGAHTESDQAEAGVGGPEPDAGEKSRDIRPLAVAGIILGIIALVGVAVGVLAVITHGFRPKTVITYRPAAVFGLRPGECVNIGANALNVTVVSCGTAHDAEVFARFSLPDTAWPGASAVQQDAGNGCASRLSGYLNPAFATADLTQEYLYPDQAAWRVGEHIVVCEIRAASGRLTGSVRAQS